jgi:hypothetical protein
MLQVLLEGEGEKIVRKAMEMALAGNETALRLVLERLIPPVKERPIRLELPALGRLPTWPKRYGAPLKR